jgi:hypothetical protein
MSWLGGGAVPGGIGKHGLRLLLYATISYGLLYFSYKYYLPDAGGQDFYAYYQIYTDPLDFQAASPPFVFRQLSAVLVFLVWKAGIYYPLKIAYHAYGVDQRVFFAAIFVNYVGLTACATAIAAATQKLLPGRGEAWPLLGGALCFFDFSAQQAVLTGLTEGVAWLLLAIGLIGYLNRSRATILTVLALSILQRELISIIFAVFAAGMMMRRREAWRFHLLIIAAAVAAFLAYVALRLSGIAPPAYENQLDPRAILGSLLDWRREATADMLFQVFLAQNLLIALAAAWTWRRLARRGRGAAPDWPLEAMTAATFAVALVVVVICFGTLSNPAGAGKDLALLTPLVAPLLAAMLCGASEARRIEAPG